MVRTFELESNYFVGRTRGRVLNMDSYPQRKHKLNLAIKYVLISLEHTRSDQKGKEDLVSKAITMVEPTPGWFELHQIQNMRSDTIANITNQ